MLLLCCLSSMTSAAKAQSDERILLSIRYQPTDRAQIALWLEDEAGTFLKTLRLTEATALRGIGNRPGASQMNSGFRWPYGRREGVLPTWAFRRLSAPDTEPFRRVIFWDRKTEGLASRTSSDNSPDNYFCLSFAKEAGRKNALDAVSCASVFNSDKGRFISEEDVDDGYSEPYEDSESGLGTMRPLSLYSAYPPRRDVEYCGQFEGCRMHPDVEEYQAHSLAVMPELDAVTMATPQGNTLQEELVALEQDWAPGAYRACLEINVEGDYNDVYNDATYPTPTSPAETWDNWAINYGYPYRGQPSVVYCVPFTLTADDVDGTDRLFGTHEPEGTVGTWDFRGVQPTQLQTMATMTDNPVEFPGAGADRLLGLASGDRLEVLIGSSAGCSYDATPTEVLDLQVSTHSDFLHAHEWANMVFTAEFGERDLHRYEVRVSTKPIVDDATFTAAEPAKAATIQAQALQVPTSITQVEVELGGLVAEQHYYLGIRAIDACAQTGPLTIAEFDTPERQYTTVSPCFVATAAYGNPLAHQVGALRRLRDRHLLNHAVGRRLVQAYYEVGPHLAAWLREHDLARSITRVALTPIVYLARLLADAPAAER